MSDETDFLGIEQAVSYLKIDPGSAIPSQGNMLDFTRVAEQMRINADILIKEITKHAEEERDRMVREIRELCES